MSGFVALNELGTITLLATALSMDAFSVGIGLGTLRMRFRQMFYMGILIGAFHVMMPYIGMSLGDWLSHHFAPVANLVAGFLLMVLGGNILFSTFVTKEERTYSVKGWSLLIFAVIVSLDSFSVGLSLGVWHMPMLFVLSIFGITAACFMWTGLWIGHYAKHRIGTIGEALGGFILLAIGFKLLLG
ncbi:MAG: manganese efflux pump MntP family protein [Bacilli bacterium]